MQTFLRDTKCLEITIKSYHSSINVQSIIDILHNVLKTSSFKLTCIQAQRCVPLVKNCRKSCLSFSRTALSQTNPRDCLVLELEAGTTIVYMYKHRLHEILKHQNRETDINRVDYAICDIAQCLVHQYCALKTSMNWSRAWYVMKRSIIDSAWVAHEFAANVSMQLSAYGTLNLSFLIIIKGGNFEQML